MNDFLKVAKEAAKKAGELLKKKISKAFIVEEKRGAVNIVTNADFEAQKLIVGLIRKKFHIHGILAEEKGYQIKPKATDYLWVIDPIDGTSAFASGLPTYGCNIALLKNNQPIVAAIYTALTDEVIWAAKGGGTFCGKQRLSGSSTIKLVEAAIGFDPGYYNREIVFKKIATPLSDKVRILPMIYSEATALALIARGNLSGYIQCGSPKVWDIAAGKLIVEEAGGIVTDFKGKPVDIFNLNGYVAGIPSIHAQLLSFFRSQSFV